MDGFYWMIPGRLAGMSRPGRQGRAEGTRESIAQDLAWLRDQGVGAILSLTETPLPDDLLLEHDFSALHLPVVDMTPPSPRQLLSALAFIDEQTADERPVAVHCLMGQGRTGTVLAAFLIRAGENPAAALAKLRAVCPHAVENDRQERALAEFAANREWIL
jgi:atypical dual specificity phosphatase